jgi:hypothetical protein
VCDKYGSFFLECSASVTSFCFSSLAAITGIVVRQVFLTRNVWLGLQWHSRQAADKAAALTQPSSSPAVLVPIRPDRCATLDRLDMRLNVTYLFI